MTVLELCSLIKNPERQEVIIHDYMSVNDEIIFKDSTYNAILSDYANCEVFNFELIQYNYGPVLSIYAIQEVL